MAPREAIVLNSITKILGKGRLRRQVLHDLSAGFEFGEHYAILGHPGAGRTTLARLIAGLDVPTRGTIRRFGSVSLPIGVGGIVAGKGSVREFIRLHATLFDVRSADLREFVSKFAGLGKLIDSSIDALSPEVRAKMTYALAYGLPCDFYVFDGVIGWGSKEFKSKCFEAFEARSASSGIIFFTRSTRDALKYGKRGGVIHQGKLFLTSTVDEAIDLFTRTSFERGRDSLNVIEQMIRGRDPAGARKYLREYLTANAGNAAALNLFAKLSYSAGAFREAEIASRRALALDDKMIAPNLMLAQVAERTGRFEEAAERAISLLERSPDDADALGILARAKNALGDFEGAAEAWQRVASGDEQNPAYANAIRCDIKVGNFSRALSAVNAAIQRDGHNLLWRELRPSILLENGDFPDFVKALGELAAIEVQRALSLLNRSRAKLDWSVILAALESILEHQSAQEPRSRNLLILAAHLRREASLAARVNGQETVARITSFLQRHSLDDRAEKTV